MSMWQGPCILVCPGWGGVLTGVVMGPTAGMPSRVDSVTLLVGVGMGIVK